jgi:hypothetical protein
VTTENAAIEQLESRLQRGWELIERAEAQNDDQAVSRYTRHWLDLLADYERLCEPAANLSGQTSPS